MHKALEWLEHAAEMVWDEPPLLFLGHGAGPGSEVQGLGSRYLIIGAEWHAEGLYSYRLQQPPALQFGNAVGHLGIGQGRCACRLQQPLSVQLSKRSRSQQYSTAEPMLQVLEIMKLSACRMQQPASRRCQASARTTSTQAPHIPPSCCRMQTMGALAAEMTRMAGTLGQTRLAGMMRLSRISR